MRSLMIIGVALTSFVTESYESTTPAGEIPPPSPATLAAFEKTPSELVRPLGYPGAAAPPSEKFHCEFDNPYFQVWRDENDPYVWGEHVEPYNATNWNELLNKILLMDQFKDAFYQGKNFDRFNSYMRNYHVIKDFFRSKKVAFDLELLKDVKLMREFNSLYHLDNDPHRLFNDNALALKVAFLRGILRGDPEVGRHLFLAIGGGTAADVEKYRNETHEYPDQLLVNENFHVTLKFSVDNQVGYVIPATEQPGGLSTIVMEEDPVPEAFTPNDEYGPESDPPVKYHLTGKNKAFIEIVRFRYDQDRNLFVPNPDWSSVIYVGRPLCSFLEAHIRRTLLYTPTLSYVAYRTFTHEGEDHTYADGFLYAHLKPGGDPMFDLGYRRDFTSVIGGKIEQIHFDRWSDLEVVMGRHHASPILNHIEMTLAHLHVSLPFLSRKVTHFRTFLEEINKSMEDYIEEFKVDIEKLEQMFLRQAARIRALESQLIASSAGHPGDRLPASHYQRMGTYHGSSSQDEPEDPRQLSASLYQRMGTYHGSSSQDERRTPASDSENSKRGNWNGIESDDDDFAPPNKGSSDNHQVTRDTASGGGVMDTKENSPVSKPTQQLSMVKSKTNNKEYPEENVSKSKKAKGASCVPKWAATFTKRQSKPRKEN